LYIALFAIEEPAPSIFLFKIMGSMPRNRDYSEGETFSVFAKSATDLDVTEKNKNLFDLGGILTGYKIKN
jgi:hypothetical protein